MNDFKGKIMISYWIIFEKLGVVSVLVSEFSIEFRFYAVQFSLVPFFVFNVILKIRVRKGIVP